MSACSCMTKTDIPSRLCDRKRNRRLRASVFTCRSVRFWGEIRAAGDGRLRILHIHMRTIVLFAFALTSCCFAESSARDLFALVETTPHDAQSPNYRERLAAGQAAALSLLRMERPAGLSVAEWSRM